MSPHGVIEDNFASFNNLIIAAWLFFDVEVNLVKDLLRGLEPNHGTCLIMRLDDVGLNDLMNLIHEFFAVARGVNSHLSF